MTHAIRTFNLSGEFLFGEYHETAEKAYEQYLDIIDNLKRTLPDGSAVTVVRFKNEKVMTMETIIGTH